MKAIIRIAVLLPVLALLWVPGLCYGAIAHVGQSATACSQTSGTTATHTCSLIGATTVGDAVLVGVAWKTTGVTVAGVTASGCIFFPYQQTAVNATSEAVALWVGLNCPAISSVTVALSGGSVFETTVNEYSGVASIGQLMRATGSSTTPAASLTTQDSGDWIVMESGSLGSSGLPTAGTGSLRSEGSTGSTANDVAAASCDNTASTPGNVTCSEEITSGAWAVLGIELRTANPADPLLVDAVGTSTNGSIDNGNGFIIYLPQAALPGNAIICGMSYPYSSSRTLTISDNASDTWTKAVSVNNGTANTQAIYYAVNVAAGAQKITFTFDSPIYNFQVACKEAYNIVADAAVDATASAANLTGPTISTGAMTTTASNDLIVQYGNYAGANLPLSTQTAVGFAPGYGWSKIIADTVTGEFFQDIQQRTTGAITPGYDAESTGSFGTVAVAFKTSASAGTPPPSSGIHIDHEWTFLLFSNLTQYVDFPSDGNFLTVTVTDTANSFAVADSQQNTYSMSAPGDLGILYYATNSTVTMAQKLSAVNTGGGTSEFVLRDIRGVATSSPIDITASVGALQTDYADGTTWTALSITPSAAGELVILTQQNGCGPPLGVTAPAGATTDSVYFTGQVDADFFDSGEGHAHYLSSGTAPISITWTMENASCGGQENYYGAAAWAIKAGTAAAPVTVNPPTGVTATVQ
jgi:hypothetical protein